MSEQDRQQREEDHRRRLLGTIVEVRSRMAHRETIELVYADGRRLLLEAVQFTDQSLEVIVRPLAIQGVK